MSLRGDSANRSDNYLNRQDGKKAKAYDGVYDQARLNEVYVGIGDQLIETCDGLMKLGANATGKIITIWRQFPEQECRSVLRHSVCLGQWG